MSAPIDDLHASNLLTYAGLGAALAAIAMAVDGGNFAAAGALLALSALADTFDGRFRGASPEPTGSARSVLNSTVWSMRSFSEWLRSSS